jgi:hypothetical protein
MLLAQFPPFVDKQQDSKHDHVGCQEGFVVTDTIFVNLNESKNTQRSYHGRKTDIKKAQKKKAQSNQGAS